MKQNINWLDRGRPAIFFRCVLGYNGWFEKVKDGHCNSSGESDYHLKGYQNVKKQIISSCNTSSILFFDIAWRLLYTVYVSHMEQFKEDVGQLEWLHHAL